MTEGQLPKGAAYLDGPSSNKPAGPAIPSGPPPQYGLGEYPKKKR